MMRHQVRSIQHSMQHSELRNPYSILRLSQVGLTVPVGRGLKDTDQQGRWSLPGAKGIRGRLGVGGWRLVVQRQLGQHAVLPLP